MDNRSLSDDLSKLFSSERVENPEGENPNEQDNSLIERLKALAGGSEEGVGKEVNEFLEGKGSLLESTRAAVTGGKRTAIKELAAILAEKFGLSTPLAQIIATLLVRLFPSISKLTGGTTTTKPKPRRKTKPKTSSSSKTKKRKTTSSAKPTASSKTKKRKTSSSAKQSTSSKAKKRKTTSSKKTASSSKSRKRKSSSRTLEIPVDEE